MTVSCVIPAFDEAARIGGVLLAVLGHPDVAEVIVVDDASRDGTAAVAERLGARVLRLGANGGKTRALMTGVAAAQGDTLLLLDADLLGLRAEDVAALLAPVLSGRAGASLSLRGNAPRTWRLIGLDYISGERAMPRALLLGREAEILALPRFGFEAWLNDRWLAEGLRVAVVPWPGVASPSKARKRGALRGLLADAAMMGDILRVLPPLAALRQIARLRARRVS